MLKIEPIKFFHTIFTKKFANQRHFFVIIYIYIYIERERERENTYRNTVPVKICNNSAKLSLEYIKPVELKISIKIQRIIFVFSPTQIFILMTTCFGQATFTKLRRR